MPRTRRTVTTDRLIELEAHVLEMLSGEVCEGPETHGLDDLHPVPSSTDDWIVTVENPLDTAELSGYPDSHARPPSRPASPPPSLDAPPLVSFRLPALASGQLATLRNLAAKLRGKQHQLAFDVAPQTRQKQRFFLLRCLRCLTGFLLATSAAGLGDSDSYEGVCPHCGIYAALLFEEL